MLDVDIKNRDDYAVTAYPYTIGSISQASLNENIARFHEYVNKFKEKNRIRYVGARYNKKESLREGLISDKMEKDYSKRLVHEVTGEIREGDGIILDDSEKAAIASNLKTGNGHLVYGKDSGYAFFRNRIFV